MSDTSDSGPHAPANHPHAPPDDEPVLLIAIGDAHGDFAPLFEAARREPAALALLQVGDLTKGKPGREQRADDDPATLAGLPIPLVWIHGNHEHWQYLGFTEDGPAPVEAIVGARRHDTTSRSPGTLDAASTSGAAGERGLERPGSTATPPGSTRVRPPLIAGYHLWPGDSYVVPGTRIRVAGVPGNYAPTWYEREKPFPGDRVRHFTASEVAAVERGEHPHILIMHEAFRGQAWGRIATMGIPVLARLVRRVQPSVCLTGHHHSYAVSEHGPTLAISLPRAFEGYLKLWLTRSGQLQDWSFVPFETGDKDHGNKDRPE